jgi:hypothetical protein
MCPLGKNMQKSMEYSGTPFTEKPNGDRFMIPAVKGALLISREM